MESFYFIPDCLSNHAEVHIYGLKFPCLTSKKKHHVSGLPLIHSLLHNEQINHLNYTYPGLQYAISQMAYRREWNEKRPVGG